MEKTPQEAYLAATYSRILDAAARVFEEKGYHDATMQDIANAAGLTKGGIYHHLPSKAETLFAINERYLKAGLNEIRAIVDDPAPGSVEKLRRLAIAIAGQHDTYGTDLRVALRESFSAGSDQHERLVWLRDRYESVIKEVFTEGVESGAFIKMDVDLLVKFFFGSLNWMSMWYHHGKYSAVQIGEAFSELLLRAFQTGDGISA